MQQGPYQACQDGIFTLWDFIENRCLASQRSPASQRADQRPEAQSPPRDYCGRTHTEAAQSKPSVFSSFKMCLCNIRKHTINSKEETLC